MYQNRVANLQNLIQKNTQFVIKIVSKFDNLFTWTPNSEGDFELPTFYTEARNQSKMRSTLRQLVREWSEEGKYEREESFSPILEILEKE